MISVRTAFYFILILVLPLSACTTANQPVTSTLSTTFTATQPIPNTPTPTFTATQLIPNAPTLTFTATFPAPTIEKFATGQDWLLYISSQEGYPAIYAARIDGSGVMKMMDEFSGILTAALSPNGSKIAFSANSPVDGEWDIYILDVDGTNLVNLTIGREDKRTRLPISESSPTWSPDGKSLAFSSGGNIFSISIDGTNLTQLTDHQRGWDYSPSWSPDGTQIAFMSTRGEAPDIYLINSDGSGLKRLTDNPGADNMPSWSPDGSKIVFCSTQQDSIYNDIYIMDADGGGQVNLAQHPAEDGNPLWSPDGTHIVFASGRDGQFRNYLMNSDGSGVLPLPEPLAGVRIVGWEYSTALSSLASTPTPPSVTPIPIPVMSAEEEITLALQTLREFFELLHAGEYEQASVLYGGSYEMLMEWNPTLSPKDHPRLLKNGCEHNGLNCLRVHDAVFQEKTDQGEFQFLVAFEYDNGTILARNGCCGATEPSPVWQFLYTVKWVNGQLLVMQLPIYIG